MSKMASRQRVLESLNFRVPDRLPKDLGGMRSSGISAFAYPKLVEALGLPPRRVRVYDSWAMLALVDIDVLDALGCDVVTLDHEITNAPVGSTAWLPYDFHGRLRGAVMHPETFQTSPDGTIVQEHSPGFKITMPLASHVFNEPHSGQPVDFTSDPPKYDLKQYAGELEGQRLRDEDIARIAGQCKRVRESTDRAILFFHGSIFPCISIHAHGGLGVFPVLCLTEPGYVADLHGIITEHVLHNVRLLFPEIHPHVDIVMTGGDDWGTQNSTIASPDIFRRLFLPYRRRINDEFHKIAPQVKTFLHSCGAIYEILDMIIESGFDVLNPVQWTAGGHSYRDWKDKCRNRMALWGGGVDAQHTLTHGTIEEVASETLAVSEYLGAGGGFIFNSIHNILAEVAPEKIVAMYQAAVQGYPSNTTRKENS